MPISIAAYFLLASAFCAFAADPDRYRYPRDQGISGPQSTLGVIKVLIWSGRFVEAETGSSRCRPAPQMRSKPGS